MAVIVGDVSQLSVAVAVPGLTCAAQVPASVGTLLTLAGHVITGGVVSLTVNVTSLVLVLPAPPLLLEPSFAVMWTLCAPGPTTVPGAGLCVRRRGVSLASFEVSELSHAQLSENLPL